MSFFFNALCGGKDDALSSGDEVVDDDAVGLTHVGEAAYNCLKRKHNHHHHAMWNVTSGKVIGEVHQTPLASTFVDKEPLTENHDNWFPEKLGEILARTKVWADVMSLGAPDGLFMTELNKAIKAIAETKPEKTIIIRFMFANIVGMPLNCSAIIKDLTEGVPTDANLKIWVGAWRKGVSWNHAKLIAIDGKYLSTGGHNMWDPHYLKEDPVHDLSVELEGRVASDGHLFANAQWTFIETKQETCLGGCVDNMPDWLLLPIPERVTVSEWPEGKAEEYPPKFKKSLLPGKIVKADDDVPLITMGRPGAMYRKARPSDDAIWAMLESAQTIIKLALQDLGPVAIPGTKQPLPGLSWPENTITALAKVIWERGVDVEIVLSNPGSIPGNLSMLEACYGNGWSCVDVAAEIIRTIRDTYPDAKDEDLRKKVNDNLRVSFIRQAQGNTYSPEKTIGMHAKHFIVDDVCTYIGSQNLYICDLAEWGVVVDDEASTKKIMEEYWDPMWKASYSPEDCNVDEVMDNLDIDRRTPGEGKVNAAAAAGVMPTDKKYIAQEEAAEEEVAPTDEAPATDEEKN